MVETAILISLLFCFTRQYSKRIYPSTLGQPGYGFPAVLFLSIIVYHWARSGDIGLRLFGGDLTEDERIGVSFLGF